MSKPQLNETSSDEARLRLVESARRICIQEGEKGLSLRKVANVAGLSHTYVYRHFSDKEALITSVRAQCIDDLYQYITKHDDSTVAAKFRIKNTLKSMYQYALEHAHVYKFLFSTDQPPINHYPEIDASRRQLFEFALDLSKQAKQDGDITIDHVTFTHLLWALFHGLISLDTTHNFNLGKTPDELINATWDIFFEHNSN